MSGNALEAAESMATVQLQVSIGVVVTFVLTLILYTLVLLLVVYCVYRFRGTNNTK